jgi:hypothetical protein
VECISDQWLRYCSERWPAWHRLRLSIDDASWLIRWLVVDTGNWLLLPSSVLGHLDPKEERFSVRLTMQQVKDSPDIDTERPVSRQMETNVYDYYGWSPYWGTGFYMGGYGYIKAKTLAPGTE